MAKFGDAVLGVGDEINDADIQLIGYCEIHCESERALFNRAHVKRMCELAGLKPHEYDIGHQDFMALHDPMHRLCKLARERIAQRKRRASFTLIQGGKLEPVAA